MMLDYYNGLIAEAYEIAALKGWHDGEDFPMLNRAIISSKLALIHSELTEAFYDWSKAGKKVTDDVMLELSDVAIRTYDLLGSMRIRFGENDFASKPGVTSPQDPGDFAMQLLDLHSCVSEALEDLRRKDTTFPDGVSVKLLYLLTLLYGTAIAQGSDLSVFVARKMEYNRLRTHRHGGKLL